MFIRTDDGGAISDAFIESIFMQEIECKEEEINPRYAIRARLCSGIIQTITEGSETAMNRKFEELIETLNAQDTLSILSTEEEG